MFALATDGRLLTSQGGQHIAEIDARTRRAHIGPVSIQRYSESRHSPQLDLVELARADPEVESQLNPGDSRIVTCILILLGPFECLKPAEDEFRKSASPLAGVDNCLKLIIVHRIEKNLG